MRGQGLLPSEAARFEEVCRFGAERTGPLAATIAAAFADDPVWKWLVHGGDEPLSHEHALVFAAWLVAMMSPVDEIHGFRHHEAVALWHAPRSTENALIVETHERVAPSFREVLGPLIGDRLQAAGALAEAIRGARPAEPHWYLGVVATHPERQGQGLGGRILDAMHERGDRLGLACYLESSNPRNHGLYRRHGYVETGEIAVAGSPPLMSFWRAPR